MERNYMTIYKRIKKTVTALDAAQMYVLNVRSNGITNWPFHEDHNPSLKLDRRFYCFVCHTHGDVIDFVSRLFGISRYDTAQRIAADFGIYAPPPTHPNIIKNAETFRPSVRFCIFLLKEYLKLLWIWWIQYEPAVTKEIPHDRFMEACKNIPIVQDLLDELRDRDADFQKHALNNLLKKENWKKAANLSETTEKGADACGN